MELDWQKAKQRLAMLWFCIGGFLFLIVFVQTALQHYGDNMGAGFSWLLPNLVPTLSLMIGVFVADARGTGPEPAKVSRFMYHLTMAISCVYLLVIVATLLVQPIANVALEPFSRYFLPPLQGLATASLGAFFIAPKPPAKG